MYTHTHTYIYIYGFACHARDPVSIPGSSRSLEKRMTAHSSILAWRIPWTEKPGEFSPWGHKELDATKQSSLSLYIDSLYIDSLYIYSLYIDSPGTWCQSEETPGFYIYIKPYI